jgi:deoxyribose-phosphate aldolase
MADAIRAYRERTGACVGLKPAGGLARARQAFSWLRLAETELGPEWLTPQRLRLGASRLLDDLLDCLRRRSAGA